MGEIFANLSDMVQSLSLTYASLDDEVQKRRQAETRYRELSEKLEDRVQERTRQLKAHSRMLFEANRYKSRFIAGVSHELRSPLNAILSLAGVLHRRLEAEGRSQEAQYLEIIEKNSRQLLTLVNHLLDQARLEAGKEKVQASQGSVQDLLTELKALFWPLAEGQGIRLELAIADDLPIMNTDYLKLRQILQNILGNAIKFTDAGKVRVLAECSQEDLQVTITDSGIGMSEDALQHVFNEYYQASQVSGGKTSGTGLGLAIAKQYVRMLGGAIEVRSQLNEGTTFIIRIPISIKGDEA